MLDVSVEYTLEREEDGKNQVANFKFLVGWNIIPFAIINQL